MKASDEINEDLAVLNEFTLYHYSKKKLDEIYSIEKQLSKGIKSIEEVNPDYFNNDFNKYILPYSQHISLFFDPIPIRLVRKYFSNEISKGDIYQHSIDIRHLHDLKCFQIAESPVSVILSQLFPKSDEQKKVFLKLG